MCVLCGASDPDVLEAPLLHSTISIMSISDKRGKTLPVESYPNSGQLF